MNDIQQTEVMANYEEFAKRLPELLITHRGKFALLRNREIIDFFDSALDAAKVGAAKFPEALFSVQEVTDEVINLGYFSYACH